MEDVTAASLKCYEGDTMIWGVSVDDEGGGGLMSKAVEACRLSSTIGSEASGAGIKLRGLALRITC